MAKYKREYENDIVKHTLTFREKEFDFSMIPTEYGTRGDKSVFSKQLTDAFPDLNEEDLENYVDVDMISCEDEEEVFEILQRLENLEE